MVWCVKDLNSEIHFKCLSFVLVIQVSVCWGGGDFGQRKKKKKPKQLKDPQPTYKPKNEPKNITTACIKNENWETGNSSRKALPFTVYSAGADFSYSMVRTGKVSGRIQAFVGFGLSKTVRFL